jgi:hypothetical protein
MTVSENEAKEEETETKLDNGTLPRRLLQYGGPLCRTKLKKS